MSLFNGFDRIGSDQIDMPQNLQNTRFTNYAVAIHPVIDRRLAHRLQEYDYIQRHRARSRHFGSVMTPTPP
jgi:hypothetical protein